MGTAAWNTLLAGRKRWVLFEPGTSKKVATGSQLVKPGEDDEAINYFVDILPRIRRTYPHARRIEVVQRPGDTLYVPAGWWHAVLNLDDTVAVTQNFVSRSSFDGAWDRTRSGRKGMARAWLAKLDAPTWGQAAKVLSNAMSEAVELQALAADCDEGEGECYTDINGTDYRGTVDKTMSGRDCQFWTHQAPQQLVILVLNLWACLQGLAEKQKGLLLMPNGMGGAFVGCFGRTTDGFNIFPFGY